MTTTSNLVAAARRSLVRAEHALVVGDIAAAEVWKNRAEHLQAKAREAGRGRR